MPDDNIQWPPVCPECGSEDIFYEEKTEYTGGGYSDYWHELACNNCDHVWKTEPESGFR